MSDTSAQASASALPAVDKVDTAYLESLLGYNARRAALSIIAVFLDEMAPYDVRPVDFSVLSVIHHNPGVTSRQLCGALKLLPPNLVGILHALEKRGLVERRPHPVDGRALGLHLTETGKDLVARAEDTAARLELDATSKLTSRERQTLARLLQKVYR